MESPQSRMAGMSPDAIAFIRFCYGRRPVPWPELYDEMSAVAARGLFRGWSFPELAEHGIGFALQDLPRLAALVSTVTRTEAQSGVSVLASAFSRTATLGSLGEEPEVRSLAAAATSGDRRRRPRRP